MFTCQNERCYCRDKSGQERVEGKRADEATVDELKYAREHDAKHVGVDETNLARCLVRVLFVEFAQHAEHARRSLRRRGCRRS